MKFIIIIITFNHPPPDGPRRSYPSLSRSHIVRQWPRRCRSYPISHEFSNSSIVGHPLPFVAIVPIIIFINYL